MKEYERNHKNKPQRPQRKYYLTISNKKDYTKNKMRIMVAENEKTGEASCLTTRLEASSIT